MMTSQIKSNDAKELVRFEFRCLSLKNSTFNPLPQKLIIVKEKMGTTNINVNICRIHVL